MSPTFPPSPPSPPLRNALAEELECGSVSTHEPPIRLFARGWPLSPGPPLDVLGERLAGDLGRDDALCALAAGGRVEYLEHLAGLELHVGARAERRAAHRFVVVLF